MMLKRLTKPLAVCGLRYVSLIPQFNFKVAVLGASGNIGQPLSLLLKLNPLIHELSLYDVRNTPGVAADLSHIDNHCISKGFTCPDQLGEALKCADLVAICAGMPRQPDQTREDLLPINADVIKELLEGICINCPKALIAIITNPVNSLVPFAACILKKAGVYDPKRLFGVTTLDVVRSRTFIGNLLCINPEDVCVPVIGGHSNMSIIPVLSQSDPQFKGSQEEMETLIRRIQDAGSEIVKAKDGGSASLSMAYAAAYFVTSLLRGLNGEKPVIECSYVDSKETEANFFSTPLVLGCNGIEQNLGLGPLNDFEKKMLECAVSELKKDIQKGIDCASNF